MENNKQQTIVLVIICVVFVSLLVYKSQPGSETVIHHPENEFKPQPMVAAAEIVKPLKPIRPKYPHCVRNDSGDLHHLVVDLVEDLTTCGPTEESSMTSTCPEDDDEDRSGMVVVYTAVTLLLVSLAAAAVEVWRVRSRPEASSAAPTTRDPPQLSRRCSLADLTVLRHNRRESMLRRDSAMHMSVDSGTSMVVNGPPHHRVPLKLLGSSKSQDDGGRRGSIATGKACKWQRSVSADKADESIPDVHHHRIHMIRHH